MEWPEHTECFLEESVLQNYVRIMAKAGQMKANIGAFLADPINNYLFSGGKRVTQVISKRNNR